MDAKVIEKAPTVTQNERTAMAQVVTRQPDGPGRRIGKRAELTAIGKVTPDGARIFRERLPQFQAEAAYWEKRVGTPHDFRVFLFDNDTRILFTIVFDGEFKPYVEDLIREATPWLDQIFGGVWEGYNGMKGPGLVELVLSGAVEAEFFYAAYPEYTRRDIEKALRVSNAFEQLLDAAQTQLRLPNDASEFDGLTGMVRDGNRFIINIPGRGYNFVASVAVIGRGEPDGEDGRATLRGLP